MSSSSKPHTVRNVPPPTGGVGSKPGNAYTRFIPREELSSFQAAKELSSSRGMKRL